MQRAEGGHCQLTLTDAQDIRFCPLQHTHTLEGPKEQAHRSLNNATHRMRGVR